MQIARIKDFEVGYRWRIITAKWNPSVGGGLVDEFETISGTVIRKWVPRSVYGGFSGCNRSLER